MDTLEIQHIKNEKKNGRIILLNFLHEVTGILVEPYLFSCCMKTFLLGTAQ